MYSARVQIHVVLHMSTQCAREGVHCGVTMETLPDWVHALPVENYPNPIAGENATRLGTTFQPSRQGKYRQTAKEKEQWIKYSLKCLISGVIQDGLMCYTVCVVPCSEVLGLERS